MFLFCFFNPSPFDKKQRRDGQQNTETHKDSQQEVDNWLHGRQRLDITECDTTLRGTQTRHKATAMASIKPRPPGHSHLVRSARNKRNKTRGSSAARPPSVQHRGILGRGGLWVRSQGKKKKKSPVLAVLPPPRDGRLARRSVQPASRLLFWEISREHTAGVGARPRPEPGFLEDATPPSPPSPPTTTTTQQQQQQTLPFKPLLPKSSSVAAAAGMPLRPPPSH